MLRSRDVALPALIAAAAEADRLVLLGDVIELRHGPLREALAAARPVLERIGRRPAPRRGGRDRSRTITTTACCARGSAVAPPTGSPRRSDSSLPSIRSRASRSSGSPRGSRRPGVRVAYPGVWLRDDVYAMHGHYTDRDTTVPILERLGVRADAPRARASERPAEQRRGLRGGARADVRVDRRGRRAGRARRRGRRERPGAGVARAAEARAAASVRARAIAAGLRRARVRAEPRRNRPAAPRCLGPRAAARRPACGRSGAARASGSPRAT